MEDSLKRIKTSSYVVREGISELQIEDLIRFSRGDKKIIFFTSDPVRFKTREAFNKWSKKGKQIYTLQNNDGDLKGIVWFGKKKLPKNTVFLDDMAKPADCGTTFAVRLYSEARGKGLANGFIKESIQKFRGSEFFKSAKDNRIWLSTSVDNEPAVKAYLKNSFVTVTNPDKRGRVVMVWDGSSS